MQKEGSSRGLGVLIKVLIGLAVVAVLYIGIGKAKSPAPQEVFYSGKTGCDFSFSVPDSQWKLDPAWRSYSGIPALVPAKEASNPALFLTQQRYWRHEEVAGGWSFVTSRKCQLTKREMVRTAEGKDVQIYLASGCDVSEFMRDGRIASAFRENILYGFMPVDDKEADFIHLSSSNKDFLLKNESLMVNALKSYSTSSPSCLFYRSQGRQ